MAMGIEAAEVFPTHSMSTNTLAGSRCSRSRTAPMIRAFAWWGITTSTSSLDRPFFSRSAPHAFAMPTTAFLNTA